jgi:hypothetical protein
MRGLQASTVQEPIRVPLATSIQNRDGTGNKDSKLVNAIAEYVAETKEWQVSKRPGLAEADNFPGDGRGMYNWNGDLYVIYGSSLYKNGVFFDSVQNSGRYTFVEMMGDGWLVLSNETEHYYTDGTTLSVLAHFDFVRMGGLVVGDQYEIVVAGNTDFTTLGAANSTPGTQFTATNTGDVEKTGTVAVVAPSIIAGVRYEIHTVGTTDFTLVGAASNTVGLVFTATGAGTGTGTVKLPNFPEGTVKGWAYLNGTLYVMDDEGQIWGTSTLSYGGIGGLDDPRIWDPLNLIQARNEPGAGIALGKHMSYVLAFKEWSVEPFYDAQNAAGSPLRKVEGAHCVYGCASADSIQEMDGTVIWLARSRHVAPQVARMDNLRAEIISTPAIERLLAEVDTSEIASWSLKIMGHRLYGLTAIASNMTLVFDMDQGLWYHWTDADGNYWPIVAHSYQGTQHYVQHESSGDLLYLEPDYVYSNDVNVTIPVDIYTPNFDAGVDRRKTLNIMRFNADQTAGSTLLVRNSDDDYSTWTNFREVNLSQKRPILTNCGTFYRRAWHFRHYANTPLRIRSVDLQLDLGTL